MKKILALETVSQYDVLPVFLDEICDGFEKEGYVVKKISLHENCTWNDLITMPFTEYDFLFCFNSILYDMLAPYLPNTILAVAFLVDHPFYHDWRIKHNNCLNYIALHINKLNSDFADKYYPFVNKNAFVPHGGSIGTVNIPYAEREYEVVFFGGYTDYRELLKKINDTRGKMASFSLDVIETYFNEEIISVEMAIQKVAEKYHLALSHEELFSLVKEFELEERFIRNYPRDILIRELLNAGQEVHVFGNGWENFENESSTILHVHKPVTYKEALNIMGNSKIVLNATPAHNNGSHERIFSAMLNGAICFTDTNLFLLETGLSQEMIMYSLKEVEKLPEWIKLVLDKPEKATLIAEHAKNVALQNCTWENVAKQVLKVVETYRSEKNYISVVYKNECERQFSEWITYIKNHSEEFLVEKMKGCLLAHQNDQSGYMQNALNSYNRYGYWGKCYPQEGNFELLNNRAKEIKEHSEDFIWIFNRLEDYKSKKILYNILRYWLDYSPTHLQKNVSSMDSSYFDFDIVECSEQEVFVDLGAYRGDSSLQYIRNFGNYKKIYCYEAFEKNMEVCKENLKPFLNIDFRECAVGNKSGWVNFHISEDSSANTISEQGGSKVKMVTLDEDIKEPISFIKMDIEGSEYDALLGAKEHIQKEHPKLAIACYHNNQDMWRLARLIDEIEPGYRFHLRYYGGSLYPSECVLYAVWKDKN